ncbi:hypothetical protein SeMB42_g06114 [Synchytrium endobioticum]|uniref:Gamma-soluble NSF attachment protein n=1 Tax=Synchytrium endobioticum TaxID=286115 RepID=A0A507CMT9_9FUNG|nr:hypothetical protein SeMB42_g06114 [Synchytrium endobioticum]TPX45519.1 hypothetical protein SeLEV6574_g03822 [Synchytrium endobioticum]
MIAEIVLILIAIVACKTNPDDKSFRSFLDKDQTRRQATLSGILKNAASLLTTGKNALPDFKVTNYVFFSIATVEDGRIYIGGFDTWFAYEGAPTLDPSSNPHDQSDQADKTREKAIHFKANQNFSSAGATYNKAAKMYESCNCDYEAACAYEDAYKCWNHAKSTDLALNALEKAATLFSKRESLTARAARLYEQAGNTCKALKLGDRAALYFGRASTMYDPSDTRALFAKVQEADTLAEYNKFSQALSTYREVIQSTETVDSLKFSMPNYILSACACALGMDDWKMLVRVHDEGKTSSNTYVTSTICRFLEALIDAHHDGDAEAFANQCSVFERTHTLVPWKSRCLRVAMDNMHNRASSIR